jgi:asparagine synthetase B (glutamine-hydrolysing)
MLLRIPRDSNQIATLAASTPTDILTSLDGWTVGVDSTMGPSRRAEVQRDIVRLVAALNDGRPELLDRALFETLFGGHFAVVALNEATGRAIALRDVVGAKTLYFVQDEDHVLIGSVQHVVSQSRTLAGALARSAAQAALVLDNFLDGDTLYDGINELPMGTVICFDPWQDIKVYKKFTLDLSTEENTNSQTKNIALLRQSIIDAHGRRVGADNVVLLSGGIDSSVMLCALRELVEPARLRAISCRVKGTTQDETPYAAELATALNVPIEIVEVDPNDERAFESFEADLLAMNLPYMGRFVYGNLGNSTDSIYFAGQDTRLHTPDMNSVDRIAYSLLFLQRNAVTRGAARTVSCLFESALSSARSYSDAPRWRRGLSRLAMAPDLDRYLKRFQFNVDPMQWPSIGVDATNALSFVSKISIESAKAHNKRHLYNMVVAQRWQSQYTDDMRYLQDVGRLNGTHVALPFYDIELARFSSTLPMAQANQFMTGHGKFEQKPTIVNKYLLRKAFSSELPDRLMLRAKAVSNTQHLLYSGIMGRKIRAIIERDSKRGHSSIVSQLGLAPLVRRFLTMTEFAPAEEAFLTRIYRIAAMCHIAREMDIK